MSDASPEGPIPRMPEDEQAAERRLDEEELDEEEAESFPASDPHSDWAGPPKPIE